MIAVGATDDGRVTTVDVPPDALIGPVTPSLAAPSVLTNDGPVALETCSACGDPFWPDEWPGRVDGGGPGWAHAACAGGGAAGQLALFDHDTTWRTD